MWAPYICSRKLHTHLKQDTNIRVTSCDNGLRQEVLTEWSLSLWMCVCALGHMQTNLSGTSCEFLGFLMIQNILCFTSGIGQCAVHHWQWVSWWSTGQPTVWYLCDTSSEDETMGEQRNSMQDVGSFLTTYLPLGPLGYFMNSTPDKGKRNLHQCSNQGILTGDIFDINLQHVRVQEKHQESQTQSLKMWLYCILCSNYTQKHRKRAHGSTLVVWANVQTFEPPRYDSVSSERQHQPHRTWKFPLQSVAKWFQRLVTCISTWKDDPDPN